jgi:hypothetical protein
VAVDQGYVAQEKAERLTNSFNRLSSMISNLITYLRTSGMKGEKFKTSNRRS